MCTPPGQRCWGHLAVARPCPRSLQGPAAWLLGMQLHRRAASSSTAARPRVLVAVMTGVCRLEVLRHTTQHTRGVCQTAAYPAHRLREVP